MDTLKDLYYRFKLWYWWYITIQKNEFHYRLDILEIICDKKLDRLTYNDKMLFITVRRDISHQLSEGLGILDIPIEKIKRAGL
jgi:hypothetical protein